MDKLLNKAITVSGKEEKLQGGKPVCKIKDEKNLTYTVYKTKQDGAVSVAWEQLQDLQIGDIVQIGFSEQTGEYEGKPVTYRTIRNFNKDIGEGMKRASEQSNTPPKIERKESSDAFGLRLAIHGMVNGMLAGGSTPKEVSLALPELFGLEEDIELRLAKPASMNVAEAKIKRPLSNVMDTGESGGIYDERNMNVPQDEDLPVIQQDEPLPEEMPTVDPFADDPFKDDVPFR